MYQLWSMCWRSGESAGASTRCRWKLLPLPSVDRKRGDSVALQLCMVSSIVGPWTLDLAQLVPRCRRLVRESEWEGRKADRTDAEWKTLRSHDSRSMKAFSITKRRIASLVVFGIQWNNVWSMPKRKGLRQMSYAINEELRRNMQKSRGEKRWGITNPGPTNSPADKCLGRRLSATNLIILHNNILYTNSSYYQPP